MIKLMAMERNKKRHPYIVRELLEPVPEKEKGIFEPFDRFNRWTGHKSKDTAIVAGSAGVILPPLSPVLIPVAIFAGLWAVGDKIQREGSRWIRNKVTRDMKPGKEYSLSRA